MTSSVTNGKAEAPVITPVTTWRLRQQDLDSTRIRMPAGVAEVCGGRFDAPPDRLAAIATRYNTSARRTVSSFHKKVTLYAAPFEHPPIALSQIDKDGGQRVERVCIQHASVLCEKVAMHCARR